jgi:hypothetical protein
MLVEYTPVAALNASELSALKSAVRGMTLEGRGSHFVFMGKTFCMRELIGQQRVWEHEPKAVGQRLFG